MNKERARARPKDCHCLTFLNSMYQCSIGFRLHIIMCNNVGLHYSCGDILPIKPGVPRH